MPSFETTPIWRTPCFLSDDEVDLLRDAVHADLLDSMQRNATMLTAAIDLLFIACNLERIGDHPTNIAEDVILLVKGVDVRHQVQPGENL